MPDLTYDAIDLLVDEDPIALRDLAWQLMRERDGARAEVEHWKSRWEAACTRLDEEGAQTVAAFAEKRRLEAERDALRAEAKDAQAEVRQLAHELGLTVAERDEALAVHEHARAALRRYDRAWIKLKAEQDAMRPVVEAAKAWRGGLETVGAARRHIALIAAIDQMGTWTPATTGDTPGALVPGEGDTPMPLDAALRELVALKDGPRDATYRGRKEAAWQRAREALDQMAPVVAATPLISADEAGSPQPERLDPDVHFIYELPDRTAFVGTAEEAAAATTMGQG